MQYHAASPSNLLTFWAKYDNRNLEEFHSALHHFADVACVARLLWHDCLGDILRAAIESDIGVHGRTADAVIAFLAGLHDLGKISPVFQRLQPELAAGLAKSGLKFGCEEFKPHGTITARELKAVLQSGRGVACANATTASILAKMAGAHHGVFAQADDILRLGPGSLGDDKWACARAVLADQLWKMLNGEDNACAEIGPKEPANAAIVPLLAGLISVADWIGSNTDYFPFDSQTAPAAYIKISAQNAQSALTMIGWIPAPVYADPAPFGDVFPRLHPNEMQQAVAELVARQSGPFLLTIEAQMGQGKTEAALYAADNSLCRGQSRGLYVALPTQATSNAMFARVRDDYLKERGHSGIAANLQLVHGNALQDDLVRVSGVCEEGNGEEPTVAARSWFTARKRPLLAPFGIGTIDQALLSVLQTRHWFVRLFGLANKVVILDEVHAYDTYTSTLLDRLLEWLSALECTVILLSATLPHKRFAELVGAYGGTLPEEVAGYPRITLASRSHCACVSAGQICESKAVALEYAADEPAGVPRLISERLSDGGCTAVICNTVNRAQAIYQALLNAELRDTELILFHARTPFVWRRETEEKVLRKFGKPDKNGASPDRPYRAVVVATQVIEQSLDLDFDWILTDMAPIDLILQRLGREHRHKRPLRAAAVSSPILTILSDDEVGGAPPEFDSGRIYERYIMLRSWLAIRAQIYIDIPGDIDGLVQWVYGEEEPMDLTQEWQIALQTSRENCRFEQREDALKATNLLVPKPGHPEDIISPFNKQLGEDDDPAVHESVKAATRDGDPSIQVVCLNRQGHELFPACGTTPVDLESEPGKALTELLGSALSIQTKGLYQALQQQSPPAGWRKSPHLRFHRAVEFVDSAAPPIGSFYLRLSRELGLVIRKIGEEGS